MTQDPHARIHREHPELTEEAEITARFAAQMLGGTLADGPPPPGSVLDWLLRHPEATSDDLIAEWARRGIDVAAFAEGTSDLDEVPGRFDNSME